MLKCNVLEARALSELGDGASISDCGLVLSLKRARSMCSLPPEATERIYIPPIAFTSPPPPCRTPWGVEIGTLYVTAELVQEKSLEEAIVGAMAASRMVLKSDHSDLSASSIDANGKKRKRRYNMTLSNLEQYMDIAEEVQEALDAKTGGRSGNPPSSPHGMPYPKNVEMAKHCEAILRDAGVTPATTAIINGRIKVGLTEEEIEFMATSKDIVKSSTRDYAHIVANGLNGATTVATSIVTARLAGIPILVTGGIGGVHRGAENHHGYFP